jgi:hypothetical protein
MATPSSAHQHVKSLSGLGDLLGDILSRLDALEAQSGVKPTTPPPAPPLLGARSPSVANKLGVLTSASQHGACV